MLCWDETKIDQDGQDILIRQEQRSQLPAITIQCQRYHPALARLMCLHKSIIYHSGNFKWLKIIHSSYHIMPTIGTHRYKMIHITIDAYKGFKSSGMRLSWFALEQDALPSYPILTLGVLDVLRHANWDAGIIAGRSFPDT